MVVFASPHRSHVPRWVAACRVLAIAVAVLSLGGQGLAARVVAASATAAIAASSAEWRASAAVARSLERASDAAWAGSDADGIAPALLPAEVSWALGPAALARVIDWAPPSTGTPAARPLVAHVARGPPGDRS